MLSLEEILDRLNTEDESVEIEVKRGSAIGKSMLETISAFSNEPDQNGGYLVLGIVRDEDTLKYNIEGVQRLDDVKTSLSTVCRENFNISIRPYIYTEAMDRRTAIIAYIPEAEPQQKPVFIKSRGVKTGAYRRISSTDQICTDEDLMLLIQLKNRLSFDETPLPETSIKDFEPRALKEYRRLRTEINPTAEELTYPDNELFDALGATAIHQGKTCATVAGILLFGKSSALRKHFPMMRVDYLRVPGNKWMDDVENRYEGLEMREALVLMILRLINQVMEDIPKRFSLPENSARREDIPLIPFRVVREAVANALMHRDYNLHSAIQVVRYGNRIEIINPGYSLIADENLGEPGASRMRNPKIASVLRDLNYAETKGTGIRTMRKMMQKANLTTPIITSDRRLNVFKLSLLSIHFIEEEDAKWLENFKDCNLADEEARALLFLRKFNYIDNAAFRAINSGTDTLKASNHLKRLRDLNLFEQRPKGAATYYIPGKRLLDTLELEDFIQNTLFPKYPLDAEQFSDETNLVDKTTNLVDKTTNLVDKTTNLVDKTLSTELKQSHPALSLEIQKVGKRGTNEEIKILVLKLCAWKTLRTVEIALLLGRTSHHLNTDYLSRMIRDELLEYKFPKNPSHSKQAYRTTDKGKLELR